MHFDLGNLPSAFKVFGEIIAPIGIIFAIIFALLPNKHKKLMVAVTLLITLVGGLIVSLLMSVQPPTQDTWTLMVNDPAPYCDEPIPIPNSNLPKVTWNIPDQKDVRDHTKDICPQNQNNQYLGLSLYPSPTTTPAEVDLTQLNDQNYNQTKLDAKVKVTFQNTQDDPTTMAGLLVQTPQDDSIGGYRVWVANTGYWQVTDNDNKEMLHGTITPSSTGFTTLEMKVYQNYLYVLINDKPIGRPWEDTLNPSAGAIGLVANGSITQFPILFSSFTLYQ